MNFNGTLLNCYVNQVLRRDNNRELASIFVWFPCDAMMIAHLFFFFVHLLFCFCFESFPLVLHIIDQGAFMSVKSLSTVYITYAIRFANFLTKCLQMATEYIRTNILRMHKQLYIWLLIYCNIRNLRIKYKFCKNLRIFANIF